MTPRPDDDPPPTREAGANQDAECTTVGTAAAAHRLRARTGGLLGRDAALLFVAALVIRSGLFLAALGHDARDPSAPPFFATNPDSTAYDILAWNLAERRVFSGSTGHPYVPAAERGPGYPAFLALVYLAARRSGHPVMVAEIPLGSALASLSGLGGVDAAVDFGGLVLTINEHWPPATQP